MITYRSLKKTLTALLKNKFPDCKVHFDNVEKSDAPYFYVEMQPYTSTVDGEAYIMTAISRLTSSIFLMRTYSDGLIG